MARSLQIVKNCRKITMCPLLEDAFKTGMLLKKAVLAFTREDS
jgi:hypothetical protein